MATYVRQSSFSDGDTITAALFNNEFNQLVNAFNVATGHTHDGSTAGDGGPISNLFSNALVFGTNTDNDVVITFNANSNDGVLTWMEDEDYFQFSDDLLLTTTEKVQFRDTAIYINSSTDGQLDIVADTEIQIAATTIDMNGNADISGNLGVGGNLTVTGTTTFNGGTITMGDAATDNVVFGADVDSHIIPDDDDTYDLGSSTQEWRNLYIDGTANIDSLVADTADINGGTIDAANITVGSGKTLDVSAGSLTLADNQISGDKVEGGTINATTINTLTYGSITDGTITVTAFVDEDNMASNSATLIPTQQSVKAYVDAQDTAQDLDLVSDSGTIAIDLDGETLTVTGGEGIDTSASSNTLTITGEDATTSNKGIASFNSDDFNVSSGAVTLATTSTAAELNLLDGTTAGTIVASKGVAVDANKDITGFRNITLTGELDAGSLDISGNVDIDGTLEADAITVNGTSLAETISDTVGAMVGSNTETGIAVTYEDSDNTLDFVLATAQPTITSLGTLTTLTVDDITINGSTISDAGDLTVDVAGNINLDADGANVYFNDGGTERYRFKLDATPEINVTGGTFTLKNNTSDADIIFSGNDDGSSITALTLDMSNAGKAVFNAGATFGSGIDVTGNVTIPTGNKVAFDTDGQTYISEDIDERLRFWVANTEFMRMTNTTTDEIRLLPYGGNVFTGGNLDVTGTVTATGTSVFASLDISGDIDVDGTTNLDVVDIDGAVDMASTLAVGGVVTANAGVVVDNITIDGQEIDVSSGDLTLDVAGDIILDADGGEVLLQDGSVTYGQLKGSTSDFIIQSLVSDKDIIFKGLDGAAIVTALTLDMSQSGQATFGGNLVVNGSDVTITGSIIHAGDTNTYFGFHDADQWRVVTGGTERIEVTNTEIVINDSSADMDFRVESDGNSSMLFVDGGNNRVGIGSSSPDTILHVNESVNGATEIHVDNANTGDSSYAGLYLQGQGNNFRIKNWGDQVSGKSNSTEFVSTAGSSSFVFNALNFIFNENSVDADFRVESNDNANMLFVDGGNNYVSIGHNTDLGGNLNVAGGIVATSGTTFDPDTMNSGTIFLGNVADGSGWGANGIGWNTGSVGDTAAIGMAGSSDPTMYVALGDGTNANSFKSMLVMSQANGVVINEDSIDADFRVENNTLTHAFYVSGSNTTSVIGINQANPAAMLDIVTVSTAGADAIRLRQPSSSETYQLQLGQSGVTNDGLVLRSTASTGLLQNWTASEVVINDDSVDRDFRVESNNNAHMLFVDGGEDIVSMGMPAGVPSWIGGNSVVVADNLYAFQGASYSNACFNLSVDNNFTYLLHNAYYGSGWKQRLTGYAPTMLQTGSAAYNFNYAADTGSDASISWISLMALNSSGAIFNEAGNAGQDFRVESDSNTHMLFVDAGNNKVSVGGTNAEGDTFAVINSGAGTGTLRINNTNADANPTHFVIQNGSASPAANDGIGTISFIGQNSAGNANGAGYIKVVATDVTNGSYDSSMEFETLVAGGIRSRLKMTSTEAVFNDNSSDLDFRVESDNLSHAFVVDGALGKTAVGQAVTGARFSVFEGGNSSITCYLQNGSSAINNSSQSILYLQATGDSSIQDGYKIVQFADQDTVMGSISTAATSSNVSYNTSSDERLKENIVDMPSQLENILKVQPRQFDWKKHGNTANGFIAQELYETYPEAVSVGLEDETQDPWSVDYGRLTPYIIKAMQEQQELIKTLTARITALENA